MSIDFKGVRVVSFASRRADEMVTLITEAGGRPVVVPSMREIPLEGNTEALEFARLLFSGGVDALIVMTGTGVRLLATAVSTRHDSHEFVRALKGIQLIALGPKPVAALKELGVLPTIVVPEPYTWNELLATLDTTYGIRAKCIAVQEYGQSNPELIQGLEGRGAKVIRIPLYRWALPEDLGPIRQVIRQIVYGNPEPVDMALFTSATQVHHLFQVAESDGLREPLRQAFKGIFIGSVGPMASRAIAEQGLIVDFEPDRTEYGPSGPRIGATGARFVIEEKNGSCKRRGYGHMETGRHALESGRERHAQGGGFGLCQGVSQASDPLYAHLDHETGRKISTGISQNPETGDHVGTMQNPRPGRRGDPDGGGPAGRGCRHHLCRYSSGYGTHGAASGIRQGRRACHLQPCAFAGGRGSSPCPGRYRACLRV